MSVTPPVPSANPSVSQEELRAWSRAMCEAFSRADRKTSFLDCLNEANRRVESEPLRRALSAVVEEVERGNALSRAMALHPDVFDPNFITVVRYGEIYGEMELTLARFADHPEDMAPRCRRPEPEA
jgi:type II secretory pathway component PulF